MKKGQSSGGDAALLVLIIAVVILLYILFLPPGDRDDLLGINDTGTNGGTSGESASILLSETPGTLIDPGYTSVEHALPAFSLYVKSEAAVIKQFPYVYTRNSLFSDKTETISFQSRAVVENPILSFNGVDTLGDLSISFNGKHRYTGPSSGNIGPIDLEYLESENELFFETSSPGWMFWRVNKHYLESVKITGDVIDDSASLSEHNFVVTDSELSAIEKARFRFVCSRIKEGSLEITLNNKIIFSGIPDCTGFTLFDIPKEYITGTNNIQFKTTGHYTIEQTLITTELEEAIYPVYYFEVSEEQLAEQIIFSLRFVDDDVRKQGDIVINGITTRLDQSELEYEKEISDFLEEGSNGLQIIPDGTLNIVELKIEIE